MSKRFTREALTGGAKKAVDASIERAKTIITLLYESERCPICQDGDSCGEGSRIHAWDPAVSGHRSERPLRRQQQVVQFPLGRRQR